MTTDALIIKGDCLNVMAGLPAASIDAIVTDPPYGLSFMGKDWDKGVPGESFWREALRVAKPGCHILAAGGTRTYHRLAVAIEDAGWEIRDCIIWMYGSGFPKSHDVSKAIDKMDAAEEQQARRYRFTEWVRSTGVTSKQIDEATGTNMGGHYTTPASQPAVMTRKHLESCRHLFGKIPEWIEREADIRSVESRNMAAREVIGQSDNGIAGGTGKHAGAEKAYGFSASFNVTTPATEAAKQWQGWGTALKPAFEPFILARKPLDGTVANNVQRHGCGGLNVDGCRVGTIPPMPRNAIKKIIRGGKFHASAESETEMSHYNPTSGRWPANVIHDGSDEAVGVFPETHAAGTYREGSRAGNTFNKRQDSGKDKQRPAIDNGGSASRFFYCAKASPSEREEGLNGLEDVKAGSYKLRTDAHSDRNDLTTAPRTNNHPTVKPVDLMKYLCRLITPPGGLILDPFCGSGSTGVAAMREGFNFIGIELNADYAEIARRRIDHERNKTPLFSNVI